MFEVFDQYDKNYMYTRPITHIDRTAFLFAIDCSGSMRETIRFNGMPMSKAEAVALVVNYMIDELVERARRHDGVRNYYDIGVIGYSGEGVRSLLPQSSDSEPLTAVDRLASRMPQQCRTDFNQTLPDGRHTIISFDLHRWIEPLSVGLTPMYEALMVVRDTLRSWCLRPENTASFPPVVFNITDGESSDGSYEELCDMAAQIRRTGTADGATLLINIHLSTDDTRRSIIFPSSDEVCGEDRYSRLLYDMASTMPAVFDDAIRSSVAGLSLPPYKGMAYNASAAQLLTVLDIGSRSVNNIF